MFGEEYRILYEYPEYFLDYREMLDPTIRWTDRLQSGSGDWTGNLFDFFFPCIFPDDKGSESTIQAGGNYPYR